MGFFYFDLHCRWRFTFQWYNLEMMCGFKFQYSHFLLRNIFFPIIQKIFVDFFSIFVQMKCIRCNFLSFWIYQSLFVYTSPFSSPLTLYFDKFVLNFISRNKKLSQSMRCFGVKNWRIHSVAQNENTCCTCKYFLCLIECDLVYECEFNKCDCNGNTFPFDGML